MQQHYPHMNNRRESPPQHPFWEHPGFWVLLAFSPLLFVCAVMSLLIRAFLFIVLFSVFAQFLDQLCVPYFLLVVMSALGLLLYLHRRSHRFPEPMPKDR